jgi:hypothetical protein
MGDTVRINDLPTSSTDLSTSSTASGNGRRAKQQRKVERNVGFRPTKQLSELDCGAVLELELELE